ncbi:hypothetical protein KY284_007898 [Solanum tuberosum]|nr:hypothetical protein KY284_007898 [Solanum tuberosum]
MLCIGLLEDDKEWNDCLAEAACWELGNELRNLVSDSEAAEITTFDKWLLQIGDGSFDSDVDNDLIKVPTDICIMPSNDPIGSIVEAVYPSLLQKYNDPTYLQERAILTPKNQMVHKLNDTIMQMIPGEGRTYFSADNVCKASVNTNDEDLLYPIEYLNILRFPGIPIHDVHLKVGTPVMLLRNLNQSEGLCNGTRLIVTHLGNSSISANIISGKNIGSKATLPRIIMSPNDSKWSFKFNRRQLPVAPCFAMTNLVTSRDDFTIRVRLCRMWDAINPKKNGELISMDMIFIDEKGNLMHGIIRKTQVNRFKDMLSEGSVFIIKNFKVVEIIGGYRPVQNSLKNIFFASTAIKNLSEDIVEIPINGFEFINPYVIDSRMWLVVYMELVILRVLVQNGRREISTFLQIIRLKQKLPYGKREELGEKFSPYLYNNDAGPYIVIVTSITVKEFCGEVSFSTTYASKIYVNLDIDYIRSLAPKFSTMSTELQVIESSNVNSLPIEEEMFLNLWTLRSCWRLNGALNYRNKIYLKVTDRTRDTTFTIFNVVAEKLIDTSTHKLFNKLTTANNDVHVQVQSLYGKEFIFKLRLNHYNLKEGLENFTISKLWIPDDNLEVQYKLRNKEKNLFNNETTPKDQGTNRLAKEMNNQVYVDVLLTDLEDHEDELHVTNGTNSRK